MKYKRMLCWVNKRTKTELSKLNQQYNIPIIFVDSFEEFENNIREETFLLILRRKADRNIRKLLKLVDSLSDYTFFAYVQPHDPCTTPREFHFSTTRNVIHCDMTDVFNLYRKNVSIKQPAELIQLFKDFNSLVSKVQLSLIEEWARIFLVTSEILIKETNEYAGELQWYNDNFQQNNIENKKLKEIKFYKKSSLSDLSFIKKDLDSTASNERKEQYTELLNRLNSLFNSLLAAEKREIQKTDNKKSNRRMVNTR